MSTAASPFVPPFVPPSPGAWELEQTHLTKPPSRYIAAVTPPAMMRGFKATTRHYGLLLDYLEIAVINGFIYMAARPVGAPKGAKGTPPKLIFKLLTHLHPEVRRRIARATEVFDQRVWREDLRLWDEQVKPELGAEGKALLSEDLTRATNAQLGDHVRRATAFLDTCVFWHHRFNGCAMVPLGDFLVRAMDWTGLPAAELLQPMRGLSPVSGGAQAELQAVRSAIAADPDAARLLASEQAPADVVAGLLARPTPAGAAARAYLDAVGLRVMGGYDVADRHAREHPEMLVKIIRAASATDDSSRRAAAAQDVERLRSRVPQDRREQFDALLAEAQLSYRIRDERVFHGDALATGIARRAILAAGERLRAEGKAQQAEHLIDATPDEIVSLLEGRPGPSSDELKRRATWRMETPMSAAPGNLGLPPAPPPPADWLPEPAAHLARVTSTVMSLLFDAKSDSAPAAGAQVKRLQGFPVSSGAYEGTARVITGVDQLPQVQLGEVLVTSSTGPTFNVVLPLIGALVTERGGVLSHAAIVSREYGLPGVVGCVGAVKAIATGNRVRVDGGTGEVWILD